MGGQNLIDPPAGIVRAGFDRFARSNKPVHGRTMAQKTGAVKAVVARESRKGMQALKFLVVGMGILIAVGLALVVYGLAGRKGENEKGFGDLNLNLPAGCSVAAADGLDGRLIVRTDGPLERGCQQIILIDIGTGKILGRVLGSN